MKKANFVPIILSSLAILAGCTNDLHQFTTNAEEILPGRWQIESVSLNANPEGISFRGDTFFNDTILFDIGEFEIGTFDFPRSGWDSPSSTSIICSLNIDDENFDFVINYLIVSGGEMYGSFAQSIPGGIDIVDTPAEEFLWSSQLFTSFYSVFLTGDQHVRLEKFNWPSSEVIELEKIE